jgi:hypothetical protein
LIDLRAQPWWTPADRAELELIAHRLVDGVFAHRTGCETCAAGDLPCPHVRAAIEAVVEWRDLRVLLSRAEWLRARQDELDQAAEAGRR